MIDSNLPEMVLRRANHILLTRPSPDGDYPYEIIAGHNATLK